MEASGLFKHADELRAARDSVLKESSSTGWVVFAYEGQANVLKVDDTGDDLEEGFQALDANKIMYLYARVIDPNSKLPKFVLVNWCGMGSPEMRKAVCASHIPEICRFLTKIHVTMNVRSEDELSVEVIQARVAKASGANYNAGGTAPSHPPKPVAAPRPSAATGYVRPNAAAEIAAGRDKFWEAHDQEDEAARKAEEARRKAEVHARIAPAKSAKPAPMTKPKPSGTSATTTAAPASSSTTLLAERDRFWAEHEAEEKRRHEEELSRIESERRQREAVAFEQERQAAAKREAETRARAEQITARKQYEAAAASVSPAAQGATVSSNAKPLNDVLDAARDEDERGKRPDAAKLARQQEIQALMKARNTQADVTDEALSKRADAARLQRQEEIRKMMAQRGGVDDDDDHRRRAEELRKQREREMQEAFSKRSDGADIDENERRVRAEEVKRKRQDEMRQAIGTNATVHPTQAAGTSNSQEPAHPVPVPLPTTSASSSLAKAKLTSMVTAVPVHVAPASKTVDIGPSVESKLVDDTTAAVAESLNLNDVNDLPDQNQLYFNGSGGSKHDALAGEPDEDTLYFNGSGSNHDAPDNRQSATETENRNEPLTGSENDATDLYLNVVAGNLPSADPELYINHQKASGVSNEEDNSSENTEHATGHLGSESAAYQVASTAEGGPSDAVSSGFTVRALYDYEGQDDDEISFAFDDLITGVQEIDSGWWYGTNSAGLVGMFPANYVSVTNDS